ncbi:MAG TPA: hypothetical protein VE968_01130 [Sphingomicrobium sp.]|nr:hypothetical protein [Sphingomicrobium sp.]
MLVTVASGAFDIVAALSAGNVAGGSVRGVALAARAALWRVCCCEELIVALPAE